MATSVTIRPFRDDDLDSVAAVFTAAVHGLAAEYYSAAQISAWAPVPPDISQWRMRLVGLTTLLVVRDEQVAGFISYADDGHIDLLFTHPAHARQGVASALCIAAESALRAHGCGRMFTEASLAARPGFEQWGFSVVEEQHVQLRGQTFLRFAMHKQLLAPAQ